MTWQSCQGRHQALQVDLYVASISSGFLRWGRQDYVYSYTASQLNAVVASLIQYSHERANLFKVWCCAMDRQYLQASQRLFWKQRLLCKWVSGYRQISSVRWRLLGLSASEMRLCSASKGLRLPTEPMAPAAPVLLVKLQMCTPQWGCAF